MEDVEEAYYDCIRGLDERIPDCKLAMHANCFGEIQRSLIHDFDSRHNGGSKAIAITVLEICVFTHMVYG